ncbi:undecaprenyl-diphosphate phosphatase [Flavisolibacter tropicus]|uniref:Undecaprenyl-diphosphatase n=1 Tax=Flavisolibacter tropicus TaxID=1492898 RepID=A0A172TZF2_9BACT|nr:undecaprenyl-diphosphate phosphatase [Flavisolibacter tropicus]ANE52328.1 UDP-diphosphatase [Flavisolibacter tropicus]
MGFFEAIIIAIVEGLTEFLPISSTGHMIITSSLLGIESNEFTKLFEVAIQLGAIMAVVVLYWKKFFQFNKPEFYAKLFVGMLPLIVGFLFNDVIEALLESVLTVAITLLVGGVVLLYVDKWFKQPVKQSPDLFATELTPGEFIEADEKLTYKKAFIIGWWQILAMIPGVSRSAASIIGGMQQRLSRNFAAEFSFFLAVPTMFAAAAYSLFLKKWHTDGTTVHKGYELILDSKQNIYAFAIGNVVAFVVAIVAIKFFINYLKKYGFRVFGIYRIIVGIILLGLIAAGYL